MRYYLFLLLFLHQYVAYNQTDTIRQRYIFGVSLSAILSNYDYHGTTPSLTVNCGNHQFSLGARVPFHGQDHFSKGKNHQVVLVTDFQYRYRLMKRWKTIRPFAFASFEYGFERYRWDQFYNHTLPYYYGPLFDHSFNYSLHHRTHELNVCFGLGAETTIWNGFYCFLNGGAGYGYSTGEEHWVEIASGNTVYSQKLNAWPWNFGWMASGGIGFRYYPKQTREERREYRKQQRIELSSPDIR